MLFPPQGLVAAALQPYALVSLLLTPNVTANSQTINAAPTASTITAANAQSFTGTIGQIALPAITPAANGSGITLTSLNFTQGAIANVADSEAITVKHIIMTFAAGAALETGVLTQTAIDITLANQAANAANNQATAIKITGGTLAGGASAYQRGIDITMAAATDAAINVVTGSINIAGNKLKTTTLYLDEVDTVTFGLRRTSDDAYMSFKAEQFTFNYLTTYLSPSYIRVMGADDQYIVLQAKDNGVGAVEIARMASAADPYFSMGPNQEFKFKYSSVADLGGTVGFSNAAEGHTGSMNIKTVRQVVTLSGAQTSTTINIPAGAMLLGASFNVDTAVVTSAATNTWDADYTGGSVTNLVVAGTAGALNTKANKLIVPEIASAQTNIEFDAPGAETFSSGAIEVVAYYIDQTSLANA